MVQLTPEPVIETNPSGKPATRRATIPKKTILVDSATYKDYMVIDFRKFDSLVLHIFNTDAANGVTYKVLAHNDDNGGIPPDTDGSWKVITPGTDVAIAALSAGGQALTDKWAWLLIQMKETIGGNTVTSAVICASMSPEP
jgi:hypothetical protein